MASNYVALTAEAAKKLASQYTEIQAKPKTTGMGQPARPPSGLAWNAIGVTAEVIESGTFGTVNLYHFVSGTLTSSGQSVQAYNLASEDVGNASTVMLAFAGGEWVVSWEDCS